MVNFAKRLEMRYGVTVPPPIMRNHNRLCAWIGRNLRAPSAVDEKLEERRLKRIAELQAKIERLS
jgi:hypothetical protein